MWKRSSLLYSSREVVRALERLGFSRVSQRGSHIKLRKRTPQGTRTVIAKAAADEIPTGTFSSILRQAGITREDFEKAVR
ncbi:MAG: type II toxin-antitoxin system HicA family toxin [Chloroflexi bacterium]|nr:type II toxin-antitoxin system HicA family toxin [Chloroflexota bacterium]